MCSGSKMQAKKIRTARRGLQFCCLGRRDDSSCNRIVRIYNLRLSLRVEVDLCSRAFLTSSHPSRYPGNTVKMAPKIAIVFVSPFRLPIAALNSPRYAPRTAIDAA